MKKYLLPSLILLVAIILIVVTLVVGQSKLPFLKNSKISFGGLGGGVMESSTPSANLMMADRALSPKVATQSIEETSLPRKITKSGSLSILVETAETTAQNIQAIAGSLAGYVSDSYLYEVTPGVKAGAITIRVPADKFDDAINRIKELAIKVESENINANDVTDQFIDLEARLKNLEAQEEQYLDILKKATAVEDVLKVTNQLNQVRQQIDSWEGQLKYLNSQIDLSTITVNLTAEKEVQIFGLNWRPITVIKQAFRSLLNGLMGYANLIIAAIIFLPVIILWLITILLIAWIVWWVVKQVKKLTKTKKKTKKSAS